MTKQSDLLRLIEGECSPEEAAAIQGWVAADPRRGELLDDLRAVWRLSGEGTRDWRVEEARKRLPEARDRRGGAARPPPLPARRPGAGARAAPRPRARAPPRRR